VEKNSLPPNVFLCSQDQALSRHPTVKIDVGSLGQATRGDWIRLLIDWPEDDGRSNEFLTAMIKEVTPAMQTAGLLKCRILSKPERPDKHTLKYGDDLTIGIGYVLEHSKSQDEARSRTAYLLEDIRPINPMVGRKYWTRDGSSAMIWTMLQDQSGAYLLGEADGVRDLRWNLDGTSRSAAYLDIVKDPKNSEVTEA
jgi:hypothetical protein